MPILDRSLIEILDEETLSNVYATYVKAYQNGSAKFQCIYPFTLECANCLFLRTGECSLSEVYKDYNEWVNFFSTPIKTFIYNENICLCNLIMMLLKYVVDPDDYEMIE